MSILLNYKIGLFEDLAKSGSSIEFVPGTSEVRPEGIAKSGGTERCSIRASPLDLVINLTLLFSNSKMHA